ncbi:MAG: hypothetical protein HYY23_01270 [Verrucomicrobia bacterium]|nr:hypothetical protein [Verrucomicrobiota bacterium]
MNLSVPQLNLVVAWSWILIGFISGMVLRLNFPREDWLGGYASFKRRLEPSFFFLSARNVKIPLGSYCLPQKNIALCHENEKDHVCYTKHSHEDQVRHVSDERIIQGDGAVSQLVQHTNENQIEISLQIASGNQIISHANHEYERTQERKITAKLRHLLAYTQRLESTRVEKGEHDSQKEVVDRSDQK